MAVGLLLDYGGADGKAGLVTKILAGTGQPRSRSPDTGIALFKSGLNVYNGIKSDRIRKSQLLSSYQDHQCQVRTFLTDAFQKLLDNI